MVRCGGLAAFAVDLPLNTLIEWFAEVRPERYRLQMKRWKDRGSQEGRGFGTREHQWPSS